MSSTTTTTIVRPSSTSSSSSSTSSTTNLPPPSGSLQLSTRSASVGPVLAAVDRAIDSRQQTTRAYFMRVYAFHNRIRERATVLSSAMGGAGVGVIVGGFIAAPTGVGTVPAALVGGAVGFVAGAGVGYVRVIRLRDSDYRAWATTQTDQIQSELNMIVLSQANNNQSIICPLTGRYFRDPVRTSDGHIYEREAILAYLRSHGGRSPTGQAMREDSLNIDMPTLGQMKRILRAVIHDHAARHTSLPPEIEKRIKHEIEEIDKQLNKITILQAEQTSENIRAGKMSWQQAASEFQLLFGDMNGLTDLPPSDTNATPTTALNTSSGSLPMQSNSSGSSSSSSSAAAASRNT